jgi:SAM-dependent methyltransferase
LRRSFLDTARCPRCRSEDGFDLEVAQESALEVRQGMVRCRRCGERRSITNGIVELMPDVPEFVHREAAGLERFAALMRSDGWDRERILALPGEQSGYWFAQATAMNQVLHTINFQPGDRLLDVGSNTCWASAMFAERGLEVIALDITPIEMQGLGTADWWMEARDIYFERMVGVMFDIALRDDSLDFVWCCEVLHHNHRANLRRTFRELFRVLRPGGQLVVVNETLRSLGEPRLRPGHEVAEFEGHEHAYLRHSYVSAAREAGFKIELRGPWLHAAFNDVTIGLSPNMSAIRGFRAATTHALRRTERGRRAYLAWKAYVTGGSSLYLLGTKPA